MMVKIILSPVSHFKLLQYKLKRFIHFIGTNYCSADVIMPAARTAKFLAYFFTKLTNIYLTAILMEDVRTNAKASLFLFIDDAQINMVTGFRIFHIRIKSVRHASIYFCQTIILDHALRF